jgi:hypothetical protein
MTTDELKKLVAAATPGPWVQSMPDTTWVMAGSLHVATIPRASDGDWSPQNARLIAAAPDLARELIALREAAKVAGEMLELCRDMQAQVAHPEDPLLSQTKTALATLHAVLGERE